MKPRFVSFAVSFVAACLLAIAFFILKKDRPASPPTLQQPGIEKIVSLADTNNYPQRPVWSPDGKLIAFAMQKSDGIEVMNADGSNRRILTTDTGSGYKFAWSPDSTEIAYRLNDVRQSIYQIKTVDVPTGKTETFADQKEELHPPEWVYSENGKRITFVSGTKRVSTPWKKMSGPVSNGL